MLLGIDVGTTAVKALVIDEGGRVLGEAGREYVLSTPREGWVQQDAELWWENLVIVVREALAGLDASGVKGVALSTQGDTMCPVDADGKPLAPARTWMDTRTGPQIERLTRKFSLQDWYQITGSRLGTFAAALSLAWWQDEMPDAFRAASRFCLVEDFIIGRLCGEHVVAASNASRTMLYDIRSRAWSPKLLEVVGIEESRLPKAAESGAKVGALTPAAAETLGLSTDVAVVLGGHDQVVGAVGSGVIRPGSLMLASGTAWVILAAIDAPLHDDLLRLQTYCHAAHDLWAIIGAYAGGVLLRWYRDEFMPGQSYDTIVAEAAEAERSSLADHSGRSPLTFLPHFYGAVTPGWDEKAKGSLLGLTLAHTRGDVAFALLRGVALETAWNVQAMKEMGAATEEIRMIGGGAKSPFWAQAVADATGATVILPQATEAAACGAGLLAGIGAGVYSSLAEASSCVRLGQAFEPHPDRPGLDAEALERHVAAFRALQPVWQL
jgi:sugar (pentulose or hexulose) kinase